jgi:hypothetical protein
MTWTVTEKRLKKGRPAYVAIWEVMDKEIILIEVMYAGTHEKAPY